MIGKPNILLVVCGPTAIGKTAAAIQVAQYFKTEIISADSRQFFREMSIGTAKPNESELSQAKHHFINSHSIEEDFNAGSFEKEALNRCDELFQSHDIVIAVGGSGLYIQALCEGFDELPEKNPAIREQLEKEYSKKGISFLTVQLAELDPVYYKTVDLANPQRLLRALEVCLTTGKPYSTLRIKRENKRPFKIIKIGLNLPREILYERINQRVDSMIQQGLLKEAENLYPRKNLNALQTVGYAELFDFFDNKHNLETAIELIKQNTRRFAKRQMTWFNRDKEINWFEPKQQQDIIEFIQVQIN